MSDVDGFPSNYSPIPPPASRAPQQLLNNYRRIFQGCADDLRRFTEKVDKHKHLVMTATRIITRCTKAVFEAFDHGIFLPVGCLEKEARIANGLENVLFAAWRMEVFPWLRRIKPSAFGRRAGEFHFYSPKADPDYAGRMLEAGYKSVGFQGPCEFAHD